MNLAMSLRQAGSFARRAAGALTFAIAVSGFAPLAAHATQTVDPCHKRCAWHQGFDNGYAKCRANCGKTADGKAVSVQHSFEKRETCRKLCNAPCGKGMLSRPCNMSVGTCNANCLLNNE